MREKRINFDYLNLYQEIPLFCALELGNFFRKKPPHGTNTVLIVNTCLIGEFAASVPAIRDYLERNEHLSVDLMVSPPIKALAESIRGVRRVYVARSLYGRRNEEGVHAGQAFPVYDTVFVMRASRDALRLIRGISAGAIRTSLKQYSGYGVHLWGSILRRRAPKQWRELNFEMLGGKVRDIPFGDIFHFKESDTSAVAHLGELHTTEKKVVIHVGVGWVMKKWENEKWVSLLTALQGLGNIRFIFVGGEEDTHDQARIAAKLAFPVYSLIGKVNLLQLLLVLRQSDYLIGTDSGPRNMAHLVDTRSLTILGPGPHFYMPWSKKDVVVDRSNGRGVFQMFFATKNGFIHEIPAAAVYDAFIQHLWNS